MSNLATRMVIGLGRYSTVAKTYTSYPHRNCRYHHSNCSVCGGSTNARGMSGMALMSQKLIPQGRRENRKTRIDWRRLLDELAIDDPSQLTT
eukprot:scaffold391818_cov19-Prasinocladus_malaysianus.AAC.1